MSLPACVVEGGRCLAAGAASNRVLARIGSLSPFLSCFCSEPAQNLTRGSNSRERKVEALNHTLSVSSDCSITVCRGKRQHRSRGVIGTGSYQSVVTHTGIYRSRRHLSSHWKMAPSFLSNQYGGTLPPFTTKQATHLTPGKSSMPVGVPSGMHEDMAHGNHRKACGAVSSDEKPAFAELAGEQLAKLSASGVEWREDGQATLRHPETGQADARNVEEVWGAISPEHEANEALDEGSEQGLETAAADLPAAQGSGSGVQQDSRSMPRLRPEKLPHDATDDVGVRASDKSDVGSVCRESRGPNPEEANPGDASCHPTRSSYVSDRRPKLEYVFGSTPWLGETTPLVRQLALDAIALEEELGEQLMASGFTGDIKDEVEVEEERRFRARYSKIGDPEEKLQAFASRQMANRMLGCLGYLCCGCWLPQEDCMCGQVPQNAFHSAGICFWLYMHPKEYLRKNNTGKLLWQALGEERARLCVSGIKEHESAMWREFALAGPGSVWCVYPPRKSTDTSVRQMLIPRGAMEGEGASRCRAEDHPEGEGPGEEAEAAGGGGGGGRRRESPRSLLHFVLIDGTWSNSRAMLNRLMHQSQEAWGGQEMICVGLSPEGPSAMHGLRPQPSKERTCTAAAAGTLLRELAERPELAARGLNSAADAIDVALECLLDALSSRRQRTGRSGLRLGTGKNLGYSEQRGRSMWFES